MRASAVQTSALFSALVCISRARPLSQRNGLEFSCKSFGTHYSSPNYITNILFHQLFSHLKRMQRRSPRTPRRWSSPLRHVIPPHPLSRTPPFAVATTRSQRFPLTTTSARSRANWKTPSPGYTRTTSPLRSHAKPRKLRTSAALRSSMHSSAISKASSINSYTSHHHRRRPPERRLAPAPPRTLRAGFHSTPVRCSTGSAGS